MVGAPAFMRGSSAFKPRLVWIILFRLWPRAFVFLNEIDLKDVPAIRAMREIESRRPYSRIATDQLPVVYRQTVRIGGSLDKLRGFQRSPRCCVVLDQTRRGGVHQLAVLFNK